MEWGFYTLLVQQLGPLVLEIMITEGCTKICFSGFDFMCLKDLILDVLVNSFSVIVGCKTSFLMTDCLVNELMNMLCKKSNI